MLAAIKRFLSEATAQRAPGPAAEDELQLAAAALLFHVIAIDGVVSDDERTMLTDVLSRRFALSVDEAASLAKKAESADAEAVDLYGFTSVLKRRLEIADREKIIEMMWKLVYADGSVHEFEDNAVWRVAELLSVPTASRIGLKKKVRDSGQH